MIFFIVFYVLVFYWSCVVDANETFCVRLVFLHHVYALVVSPHSVVVETVTYDELVWNLHGTVFHVEGHFQLAWLHQQGGYFH